MSTKLVSYARRILRDEAGAYDVIQDVFVKLWDIRENLDPDSSLQSLLYTMTRNASLNAIRKRAYLVHPDPAGTEGGGFETMRAEAGADSKLQAKDLGEVLNRWIDELPERRKEAFVLSRHHDLSHREISKIMGLSERTVNTHIFLALKQLRARLDVLQNENVSS
jgi:RNA polymerase sigma-70 factor (ECF subfamily)